MGHRAEHGVGYRAGHNAISHQAMTQTCAIAQKLAMVMMASVLVACQSQTTNSPVEESAASEGSQAVAAQPKKVFSSDFDDACQGIPVAGAASYDLDSAAAIHPIYAFARENENETFYERSSQLPDAWKKDWQQAAETELVLCLTATDRQLSQKCEFKEEGEPVYVLETYDTTYEAEVRVAQTGELLEAKTLALKADSDCPMFHMFTEGETLDTRDASSEQAVIDLAKPHVQPGA